MRIADMQFDISADDRSLRQKLSSALGLVRNFARVSSEEAKTEIKVDTRQASAAIAQMQGRISNLRGAAVQGFSIGGGALASFGGNLLTKAFDTVTGKIGDMTERGKNLVAFKETAQIAFETLLKDGQKAKTMLGEIAKFSTDAGMFDFPGITQAAKGMLAFGFESDKVIPSLKNIAEAAAVLGNCLLYTSDAADDM
jgi:hypothetical protein